MLYSFYRFSHCQDRALERDRPQQRKKQIPMDLCGFCLVWLRPRFVLFRCFFAGETQIWPGDLRVVAVAVFFLFVLA